MFGFCITHILNTGCAKIWKKKSVARRLTVFPRAYGWSLIWGTWIHVSSVFFAVWPFHIRLRFFPTTFPTKIIRWKLRMVWGAIICGSKRIIFVVKKRCNNLGYKPPLLSEYSLAFQPVCVLDTSVFVVRNTILDPTNRNYLIREHSLYVLISKTCGYLYVHRLSKIPCNFSQVTVFFIAVRSTKKTPDWNIKACLTKCYYCCDNLQFAYSDGLLKRSYQEWAVSLAGGPNHQLM